MKTWVTTIAVLAAVLAVSLPPTPAVAELNAEQRAELSRIRRDVTRAASLVRRKEVDEAEKIFAEAEKQLMEIAKAAELEPNDRAITSITAIIAVQRQLIARQTDDGDGKSAGVSYVKDVAPILQQRCGNCHGNNPRGGLQLTTFAGMKKGGNNAPLLIVGNPTRSLIIRRLLAPANLRMPKNGQALPAAEIQTIARWIDEGAKFDGKDENAAGGGGLAGEAEKPKPEKPKVEIAMATGDESVSFTKDIAPFMVNLCLRCHSGNEPRSGFSIETFEKLMQGGDSGQVVFGGDLEASRLWDLAGKQDPIKMPPGNALMTRTNWRNLRTWIEEGAKYDGGDPTKPLRDLVPTEAEVRAMELAKLTPAERAQLRLDQTKEMWDRVLPKQEPQHVETDEFLVFGNVTESRLKQIGEWAEKQSDDLRTLFREKDGQLWPGKLAIIVFKERFGYDEFNLIIHKREAPREMIGHSVVEGGGETAYIAILDVSDTIGADSPNMQVNLGEHVAAAYLKHHENKLPDWLLRGTGLSIATRGIEAGEYLNSLKDEARDAIATLEKAEDLFADGTFSPTTTGAVGYTLVEFLRKAGNDAKFAQFVDSLAKGAKMADAVQSVYRTDLKGLAIAYAGSFKGKR